MTSWAERQDAADAEWRIEREKAQQVACPRCGAGVGVTCTNPYTGEAFKRAPAHWQRIWVVEHGADLDGAAEETQG
jgi:hypothetical protein